MKDIMLKIVGKQVFEDEEADQIEFVTEGKLYERGNSLYLIYDESEFSGMPGCKTSLKVAGDTLRMSRVGGESGGNTAIEFEKGKRYTSYYDTPYGAVEMEVLTNFVRNNLKSDGGTVHIDYNVSLKGLAEGRSKLDIEVKEIN